MLRNEILNFCSLGTFLERFDNTYNTANFLEFLIKLIINQISN